GYGFGFRGTSPPWPYVGRGRGGFPRCHYSRAFMTPTYAPGPVPYPAYTGTRESSIYGGCPVSGATPYAPQMTREQELDFLKDQSEAIKAQLEQIGARIRELETTAAN
ncbi:hypothetical protein ACFLVX_04755, partial [Chloroflexota bacterium]